MLNYKEIYNNGTKHHHVNFRQDDFKDIPISSVFMCGGNVWFKQSTRTARLLAPNAITGVYYFDKSDLVKLVYSHNYEIKGNSKNARDNVVFIDRRFLSAYVS